jgi:hypothetical protein
MTFRAFTRSAALVALMTVATAGGRVGAVETPSTAQGAIQVQELTAAIKSLGAFDFPTRLAASRVIRRTPAAQAVPALIAAAKAHADSYVRYRALVLLAGFGDASTPEIMRSLMADPNDRLRAVAYAWFEHHPSPAVVPVLIDALSREVSEFVRPSLTRALAAQKGDARAQAALLPLVTRGEDFFRGEVIVALGDYRITAARDVILSVAKLEGPLQDDAVLALGKLGDASVLDALAELQRTVPRERQPSIAAAICLLGLNCDAHHKFLAETLRYAVDTAGFQLLLRGAAHALGALATRGDQAALATLFDAGIPAADASRAPIALAIGAAAVRDPAATLRLLGERKDQTAAIELLRDAFDMLEEDFEEELFYVDVRRAYWGAPEGSTARNVAAAVIEKLEF